MRLPIVKTSILVVLAGAAALLLYAATQPDTFRVERSVSVGASPDRVFSLINDMHAFNTWNPYVRKDPAIKGVYTGPAAGQGAGYGWQSSEVGVGSMEVTHSTAPTLVAMKLDFVEPFEAHNRAEFTLRQSAGETHVTWAMFGPVPYTSKVMHVLFNIDKMVGSDFERGLHDLKRLAEAG
jgi:hypothetical protein